jgi:hypothetical protein
MYGSREKEEGGIEEYETDSSKTQMYATCSTLGGGS